MSIKTIAVGVVSVLLPLLAASEGSAPADQWFSPTRVTVRSGTLLKRDFSTATMTIATDGDTRIETSGLANGKDYSGILMLVSGNYMLAKGVELSPGAEIDAIDAPVLEAQTVMKLLARVLPAGPKSVIRSREINFTERKEPLEVATQSASGAYPPPWSLTGFVKRESATKIAFSLSFTFSGTPQPLSLVGAWENFPAVALPDSTSVKGWRAFHLGPHESNQNGGSIMDYGAQEIAGGFSTIGEVRAYAKRKAGGA
jgi:hypothetical protein